MDKWSVALFGHYKPRYELREKRRQVVRMPVGKNAFGQTTFRDVAANRTVGYFLDPPTEFDQDNILFTMWWDGKSERPQEML